MNTKIKFTVYGKEGCGLCQSRVSFLESFCKNAGKSLNFDYVVEYLESTHPLVMTDMIMDGVKDIPAVVMRNEDTDKIVAFWDGPTDFPNSKKVLDILFKMNENV